MTQEEYDARYRAALERYDWREKNANLVAAIDRFEAESNPTPETWGQYLRRIFLGVIGKLLLG